MRRQVTYILFSVLLFGACKKENAPDCFKSSGKEVSRILYPASFSRIEIWDNIEVSISKGISCQVEVFAGEHIIKKIGTNVEAGVLTIRNNNTCNFVRGYKRKLRVHVTLPVLHGVLSEGVAPTTIHEGFEQDAIRVEAEGSGDIYLNGNFSFIEARANGNGNLIISGSCDTLRAFMNGTNFLYAQALRVSEYTSLDTRTVGDCYLNTEKLKKLDYWIYRSGNIYYTSPPKLIYGVIGDEAKGKFIQKN